MGGKHHPLMVYHIAIAYWDILGVVARASMDVSTGRWQVTEMNCCKLEDQMADFTSCGDVNHKRYLRQCHTCATPLRGDLLWGRGYCMEVKLQGTWKWISWLAGLRCPWHSSGAALHLVISNVHSSICDAVHFECNEVVGQLEPDPALCRMPWNRSTHKPRVSAGIRWTIKSSETMRNHVKPLSGR